MLANSNESDQSVRLQSSLVANALNTFYMRCGSIIFRYATNTCIDTDSSFNRSVDTMNASGLLGICRLAKCTRCIVVVVVKLLFYVHDKHLRSCRDGQLT